MPTRATGLGAWTVREEDFPHGGSTAERLLFLVRYAILAPSSHNTQPWYFRVGTSGVEVFADRSRLLPQVDPAGRELTISCGAAIYNLRLAMRYFSIAATTRYLPNETRPDLMASIDITGTTQCPEEDRPLFHALTSRHTNRGELNVDSLPVGLLGELQTLARQQGAWLRPLEADERERSLDLIVEASRAQMSDPRFRRELSLWLRADYGQPEDGMPGYAVGTPGLPSLLMPWIVRTFDVGARQARKDRHLADHSGALFVLGTATDTRHEWLASGQALSAVLLRARVSGLWASFFNQPLEVQDLRARVAAITNGVPQIIARLGYGSAARPAPRRSVSQVAS